MSSESDKIPITVLREGKELRVEVADQGSNQKLGTEKPAQIQIALQDRDRRQVETNSPAAAAVATERHYPRGQRQNC
jgi:hypothetical protein